MFFLTLPKDPPKPPKNRQDDSRQGGRVLVLVALSPPFEGQDPVDSPTKWMMP